MGAASNCYDVKLIARPIEQIPSEIPDCGSDCIIMSWPWFVDLKVTRVLDGQVADKTIGILTVQHTYMVRKDGVWLLRMSSTGGYNALRYTEEHGIERCPAGTPPTRPYIGTGDPHALNALREAGKARYGTHAR